MLTDYANASPRSIWDSILSQHSGEHPPQPSFAPPDTLGPSVQALSIAHAQLLLACVSQPVLEEMCAHPLYWQIVHRGLRLTAVRFKDCRKASLRLLKLGLDALSTTTPCAPEWRTFETVMAAVQDFPPHLLLSGFMQDALLSLLGPLPLPPCHQWGASESGGSGLPGVDRDALPPPTIPVPHLSAPPQASWATLALDVFIFHENPTVARATLALLLHSAIAIPPALALATEELSACGMLTPSTSTTAAAAQSHWPIPGLPSGPSLSSPSALLSQGMAEPTPRHSSYTGAGVSYDGSSEGCAAREAWEEQRSKIGGAAAVAAAAASGAAAGDVTPTALLFHLPPWYFTGAFLAGVGGGSLWGSEGGGLSLPTPNEVALRGCLGAYLTATPQQHRHRLWRACLKALLPTRLVFSKVALRATLEALARVMEEEGRATATATATAAALCDPLLTPPDVAALRHLYVCISHHSSKAYTASISRLIVRILCCTTATPLTLAIAPQASLLLALLPARHTLTTDHPCTNSSSSSSSASASIASGAEDLYAAVVASWVKEGVREGERGEKGVVEGMVAAYLAGNTGSGSICGGGGGVGGGASTSASGESAVGVTAVGVARLFSHISTLQAGRAALEPLKKALHLAAASTITPHTVAAAASPLLHTPLTLLLALACGAWPEGGAGDAAWEGGSSTGGGAGGGARVDLWCLGGGGAGGNPLGTDVRAGLRACESVFPAWGVNSGPAITGLPSSPLDLGGEAWPHSLSSASGGGEGGEGEVVALGETIATVSHFSSSSSGGGGGGGGDKRKASHTTPSPLSPAQACLVELLQEVSTPLLANIFNPWLDFFLTTTTTTITTSSLDNSISLGSDEEGLESSGSSSSPWGFVTILQLLFSLAIVEGASGSGTGGSAATPSILYACQRTLRAAHAVLATTTTTFKGQASSFGLQRSAFLTIFRLLPLATSPSTTASGGGGKGQHIATLGALLQASPPPSPPQSSSSALLYRQQCATFQCARWAAIATCLGCIEGEEGGGSRGALLPSSSSPSFSPSSPNLSTLLLSQVCLALEVSGEEALPALLSAAAFLVREYGKQGGEGEVEENLKALLSALETTIWQAAAPTRRVLTCYACAVLQPEIYLGGGGGGGGGGENGENGEGRSGQHHQRVPALHTSHMVRAVKALGGERVPSWALQIFTARCVALWTHLIGGVVAGGSSSSNSSSSGGGSARQALLSHVPLMLALSLHRESVAQDEDPLLMDSNARRTLFSWMAARHDAMAGVEVAAATGAGEGGEEKGTPEDPHAALQQCQDGLLSHLLQAKVGNAGSSSGGGGASSLPHFLRQPPSSSHPDAASQELCMRGAGALTRLQILCFFDDLATVLVPKARTLARAAAASYFSSSSSSSPHSIARFLIFLQRTLILRLSALHTQPSWLAETSPGTSIHVLRLRAWQALLVLAAPWGAGGPLENGSGGGGLVPFGGGEGAVFLPSCDAWLEGGGDGGVLPRIIDLAPPPPTTPSASSTTSNKVGRHGGKVIVSAVKALKSEECTTEVQLQGLLLKHQQQQQQQQEAESKCTGSAVTSPESQMGTCASDNLLAASLLHMLFHPCLATPQQPSTRHYMESLAVALARRFPSLATQGVLAPSLACYEGKTQVVFCTLLVACDLALHCATLGGGGEVRDSATPTTATESPFPLTLGATTGDAATFPHHHTLRSIALTLLKGLLPWVTTSVGLSRLLAQTALYEGFSKLYPSITTTTTTTSISGRLSDAHHPNYPPQLSWVAPLINMLHTSPDISEQRGKCAANLARVSPAVAVSLPALLATSPVSEHGEFLPRDTFSYISAVFRSATAMRHRSDVSPLASVDLLPPSIAAALGAGMLPRIAAHHAAFRWPLGGIGDGEGEGGEGGAYGLRIQPPLVEQQQQQQREGGLEKEEATSTTLNFQRKVGSSVSTTTTTSTNTNNPDTEGAIRVAAELRGMGLGLLIASGYGNVGSGLLGGEESTTTTNNNSTSGGGIGGGSSSRVAALLPSPHPLLTETTTAAGVGEGGVGLGRGHQPFIVCASLVEKSPNLGGLARSCEIFGAESLVVPHPHPSRTLFTDPAFFSVSMDAERLLPIHGVPPSGLRDYIRAQRARGWVCVALEQASRSVVLGGRGSRALPRRMLLVLGAEKEGLPVEILAEVDVVVEIPQLGVLRSLNVHVSAALVMWEYVRQGLEGLLEEGGK